MPLSLIVGPPNSGRAGEIAGAWSSAALDAIRCWSCPRSTTPTGSSGSCARGGGPSLGVVDPDLRLALQRRRARDRRSSRPPLLSRDRSASRWSAPRVDAPSWRCCAARRARPGSRPRSTTLIGELQAALRRPRRARRARRRARGRRLRARARRAVRGLRGAARRAGRADEHALAAARLAALRARPASLGRAPGLPLRVRRPHPRAARAGRRARRRPPRSRSPSTTRTARRWRPAAHAARASCATSSGRRGRAELEPDAALHAERRPCATSTGASSSPTRARSPLDDGLALLECAGERGEAEAIGGEVARLLADGVDPGDIAVVVRHPLAPGRCSRACSRGFGIPVARRGARAASTARPSAAASSRCCARGLPDGDAPRTCSPTCAPTRPSRAGIADWLERRIRRGEVQHGRRGARRLAAAPPRHLAAAARRAAGAARLARWRPRPASSPRRRTASRRRWRRSGRAAGADDAAPARAARRRGGRRAARGARRARRAPGCPQPALADALEALEGAACRSGAGPTEGRVRVLSPYRLRAGRARHLFVRRAPGRRVPRGGDPATRCSATTGARALGIAALRRREQADEERYLFHACVSRPTERLWLSLAKLRRRGHRAGPLAVRRRGPRPARPDARGAPRTALKRRARARTGSSSTPRGGPERARARPSARRPRPGSDPTRRSRRSASRARRDAS